MYLTCGHNVCEHCGHYACEHCDHYAQEHCVIMYVNMRSLYMLTLRYYVFNMQPLCI